MLSVAPSVISLDPHPCWPSITVGRRSRPRLLDLLVLVGMPGSSYSYSSSDPSSLLESEWPDSPESPESTDAKRLNAVCFFWTCGEPWHSVRLAQMPRRCKLARAFPAAWEYS